MKSASYPTYRQTTLGWLSKIPAHWRAKRLKYLASCNDDLLSDDTSPDTEIRYVDISSVSLIGGIENVEELPFDKSPSRARRRVNFGDTLLSTVRPYLKAIALVDRRHGDCIVSTGFAVIRPKSMLLPAFLSYQLQSTGFIGEVVSRSVGVSYPAINASDVMCLPVTVPPLDEQEAIAQFLHRETARLDSLIDKRQRMIELLREKRAALITHAVTRGLDPEVPLRESGITWLGRLPAHWVVKQVKRFAVVGNGSTPDRADATYWDDGHYPWLNSSVANAEEVTGSDQFVTENALRECHLPKICPPAVLIGITGQGKTRGLATTLRIEATINQHLVFVKPRNDTISADFLRRVFDHSYSFLRSESDGGGSTKGAITCDQISNLWVAVPPTAEQDSIVRHIGKEVLKLAALSAAVSAAITRLTEYRAALITAAVTGQIDVRT